jgi:hypothetical protein
VISHTIIEIEEKPKSLSLGIVEEVNEEMEYTEKHVTFKSILVSKSPSKIEEVLESEEEESYRAELVTDTY